MITQWYACRYCKKRYEHQVTCCGKKVHQYTEATLLGTPEERRGKLNQQTMNGLNMTLTKRIGRLDALKKMHAPSCIIQASEQMVLEARAVMMERTERQ